MKKYSLFVFVFILMISFAIAIPLPQQFYGEISYNNQLIGGNCEVILKTSDFSNSCLIKEGTYGYEPTCFAETENLYGSLIEFYLEGKKIGESNFIEKETTRLNFILDFSPACASIQLFCGDSVCNNAETCSTCPGDCGICQENTGGSSPSGSSNINPNNNDNSYTLLDDDSIKEDELKEGEINQDFNSEGFSWITGGVIGALGGSSGIGLIIGLIIILIGLYIFSKRKNKMSIKSE